MSSWLLEDKMLIPNGILKKISWCVEICKVIPTILENIYDYSPGYQSPLDFYVWG